MTSSATDEETMISSASESERPVTAKNEIDTEAPTASPAHPTIPKAEAPSNAAPTIPDGGLEAWLQVLGSWVVLVDTWGLVNSFGVFQTYYETELLNTRSSSDISWIGSLQASLLMLVGVLSGPLYDAGYFRELIAVGLFLIVFGQFMTSLCTTYWQVLLAQGITIGIGMGLTFLPSTAVLAQYFRKRRALAVGIASTGSPLTGIVVPIIFSRLQPAIGFGWATRVIAFILLAINVVPVIFLHTRNPPSGRIRSIFDATALRDVPFMLVCVASFFSFLCLYVPFFYIQLFTELHHYAAKDFSPYLVTLLGVGSVFGRIVPNGLADHYGNVNVILGCALGSAVLLFGWLGIFNLAGLVVFALLYGLFSGGIVGVIPSVVMSLTPDMSQVGTRLGMVLLVSGISILVGTPIAGAILGGFSDVEWRAMIGYTAGGLTISTFFFLAGRLMLFKRKSDIWA